MGEIGPVVVRPGGESRILSIREAIKLKAYLGNTTPQTSTESDRILNDIDLPIPSRYKERRDYHSIEKKRARDKTCQRAKEDILEVFGYSKSFTIRHPEFVKVCERYDYAPGSLAGALVRNNFVERIAHQVAPCKSKRTSTILVYRIVEQPQH